MAVNGKGEDFNGSSASKRKRAAASIEAERGAYAELLQTCLRNQFAIEDAELLSFLQAECGFVELYPGDRLIEQGVKHDDVYFVLSGRLRAVRTNEDGQSVTLGEIGRGETVGELALFTGEPRSADVIAVRNSFIAILSRATVEAAIAKLPTFALAMTKTVIERFRREQEKTKPPAPPVIVTVMPISPGVDAIGFVQRLAEKQRAYSSKVAILDLKAVSARFGSLSKPDILRPRGELSSMISALEGENNAVYLVADPTDAVWSLTAIHHADEVLMLADATADPAKSRFEQHLFDEDQIIHGRTALVLVHPENTVAARNTAAWLKHRKVDRHFHVRHNNMEHIERLARILSGNAIGIVLSGGGARGFAHVGVMKALTDLGVKIDFVGGTSIGAIMGAFAAMEVDGDEFVDMARRVFVTSPFGNLTGDYNFAPLVSLIKGGRARSITRMMLKERTGSEQLDLEDTWKTFFVVASNYTTHSEEVICHGDFVRGLVASFSIPGLLPPVLRNGETLFDGGSFNNFPVDIMRGRFGAGKVIGVDLLPDYERRYDLDEVPPPMAILRDAFRSKKSRRYRLPSLPDTLFKASFITAMARQKTMRGDVDLLFRPMLRGVSMLDWKKYDQVVEETHKRALAQLTGMDAETAKGLGVTV